MKKGVEILNSELNFKSMETTKIVILFSALLGIVLVPLFLLTKADNASDNTLDKPVNTAAYDFSFEENLLNLEGCQLTDLGLKPLSEFSSGDTYNGFPGRLYPGGNDRPQEFTNTGLSIASQIEPLNQTGQPDKNGKVVMASIGMSNTRNEFKLFIEKATAESGIKPSLVIVNAALGGYDVMDWGYGPRQGKDAWAKVPGILSGKGVTSEQVQIVWMKQAFSQPSQYDGGFPENAEALKDAMNVVIERATKEFPNLKLIYISSRTRAYTTVEDSLNPEPYAFEGGFAVKWLIEEHLNKGETLPWIGWGPYIWDDEATDRSDGFAWTCSDTQDDFTHPSESSGEPKIGQVLLDFFKTDEVSKSWFLRATVNTTRPDTRTPREPRN